MGNRHSQSGQSAPDSSPPPSKKLNLTELNNIKLSTLQDEVGHSIDSPKFTIIDFENWGKTQKPRKVFHIAPATVEQVQKVVKAAAKFNLKVRAAGSTHSWSPLYPDEGNILIDGRQLLSYDGHTNLCKIIIDDILQKNDKILLNKAEPNGQKTVTIAAGVTTKELMEFFDENKVCFPSNVILRSVTCAGIVATGCHGVGGDQLTLSDWITAITLVDSKGDIREFSTEKDGDDIMKAIQVSLGMFGIFINVTMKVQDQFLVQVDNLFPIMKDYFFNPRQLKEFVNKNWSVEMFWFPFNGMEVQHLDLWRAAVKGRVTEYSWNPMIDELWVRAINPYKKDDLHLPPVGKDYRRDFTISDQLKNKMLGFGQKLEHFLDDMGGVGKAVDQFVHRHFDPVMLYLAFKIIKDEYSEAVGICEDVTNAIHYRSLKGLIPVYDMSFAFNCPDTEEGFLNACKAITYVVELVQKKAVEGKYPLTTSMEMRWISHTDTLLAPAIVGNPKGYTLYLEILSFEDTDDAKAFLTEVAKYWMTLECDGVKPLPHWGKMWSFIPGINQYIREGYGENIEKFKEARKNVNVDPDNMFTNGRLIDIFQLPV